MNDCPRPEVWNAFLAESLGMAERASLMEHLAHCTACQATLNRLAEPEGAAALNDSRPLWSSATTPADLPRHLRDRLMTIVQTTPREDTARVTRNVPRGDRIGDFIIESEVGRGGMGVVYRARDVALGRVVAVKVLAHAGGDTTRFRREAAAVARVRHDHVVPVLSAGVTADGEPYYVMPFIEGLTLRQLIERERVIPCRQAAEYVRQIADALTAVHGAGLVHRDIKPENVLIDPNDQRAKLTDFGLARDQQRVTHSTTIAGTPEYLSPEQISAPDTVGAASDIYSLGVTLYEAVAGTTPFRGPPHHILQRIVADEPPRPRTLQEEIAPDLETIILTAMASAPKRRYASAESLRDELTRWLAGQPIQARPAGPLERGWKWARRHPWPTIAGVCAIALAISLIAAVFVQRRIADRIARVNETLQAKIVELNELNRELAFAKEDAEKAYRLSRIGVNRTINMIKERLADVPKSEPLVLELLRSTSDIYRQLAELRPADAEMAADYADALRDLTNSLARSGRVAEAAPILDRFEAEVERQRFANPHDPKLPLEQLDLLKSREQLLRRQKSPDLADATNALNRELDRQASARPDDPRVISLLFDRSVEQMMTAGRAGDNETAWEACRQAVEFGKRWRRAAPRDQTAARQLALQLGFLATLSHDLKKYDEALEAANELETVCDDPVHPAGRSLAYRRGNVWLVRGLVAKEKGDLDLAAEHLAKSESTFRTSDAEFPREYNLRTQLVTVLFKECVVAAERMRSEDARRYFDEARAILQKVIAEYPSDTFLPAQLAAMETEWKRLSEPQP